jgi:phosphonate transport system substrate-binding protein
MKNTLIFLCCILLFSCGKTSDLDENNIPKKIIVVFNNSGDNTGSILKAREKLKNYLAKKLNKEVEFYVTTDYTSVIEAINSKKAHIAYLSPFSYILAAQKKNVTPLVAVGMDGEPRMYSSVIFTSSKSSIKSMDDVKKRAKTLSLCFSDPASASGHLVPRAYLESIALSPDKAFQETLFAGTHPASVLTVKSGKVDIGCTTAEFGLQKLINEGFIKKEDIRILWKSDPIVASPICIRSDINKEYSEKIKNIFLNLAKDDPEVFISYIKIFYADANKMAYFPVNDSLYNGIRKIASGIKDINLFK